MHRYRLTTPRAIGLYAAIILVLLGGADYFYARASIPPVQPASSGVTSLVNRVAWYEQHATDFDLLFLGDSKVFCGIHPELLDPLLQTRSLNLASFANWLPTQLPLVQRIAPQIPKGTTVVWSIGTINFWPSTGVQRVYPIGIANAARYLAWGVDRTGFFDNVFYSSPPLHFLSQRGRLRQNFLDVLNQPFRLTIMSTARAGPVDSASLTDDDIAQARKHYQSDPNVETVVVVKDADKVTSLEVYFKRGSYYRVELDPAFFRRKQQEITSRWQNPAIDESLRRVFEEILQTFKANGVNLIVNEMEEAPFIYGGRAPIYREFMRDEVQRRVEELGFKYVRVDFDRLTDEDYFDYNHLNSRGAQTFIPMLAEALRPHLRNERSPQAKAAH